MVDDGVIVGKNGSFMAAWLYEGDDNASSTDRQRDMVSFRINQALAGLGNGWMIHVDAPRRPAAAYLGRGPVAFSRRRDGSDRPRAPRIVPIARHDV
jgi:type IV secretion system protein VirB4